MRFFNIFCETYSPTITSNCLQWSINPFVLKNIILSNTSSKSINFLASYNSFAEVTLTCNILCLKYRIAKKRCPCSVCHIEPLRIDRTAVIQFLPYSEYNVMRSVGMKMLFDRMFLLNAEFCSRFFCNIFSKPNTTTGLPSPENW